MRSRRVASWSEEDFCCKQEDKMSPNGAQFVSVSWAPVSDFTWSVRLCLSSQPAYVCACIGMSVFHEFFYYVCVCLWVSTYILLFRSEAVLLSTPHEMWLTFHSVVLVKCFASIISPYSLHQYLLFFYVFFLFVEMLENAQTQSMHMKKIFSYYHTLTLTVGRDILYLAFTASALWSDWVK